MVRAYEQIGDLELECGKTLKDVRIAFNSVGRLTAAGDNVILALHGYTSGPEMIEPTGDAMEGSWRELIGPGKAIDTDRNFVICPNAVGSSYGSTGAGSVDPQTGQPYGSAFPPVTMRDVVNSQYKLLERLGIHHVVAVVGASFGGLQALQWAVAYPRFMQGIVAALASLGAPPVNIEGIRTALARDPNWNAGDYYRHGHLTEALVAIRVGLLKSYGTEVALAPLIPDPAQRATEIERRARAWAKDFDANALLVLMRIMATHNINTELHNIRARILYVLSRTDPFFPPTLAASAMTKFRDADVVARYFEIDSDKGHAAATSDAERWAGVLEGFLNDLTPTS
jgi:homoserine O-acetyltransferase/O-succinyltransferase